MQFTRHVVSPFHEHPPGLRMMPTGDEEEPGERSAGEGAERGERAGALHWTAVTLYFADGSGLISRWQHDHAEQEGVATPMTTAAATAEHLRALQEVRCTGGATNWYLNPSLDPSHPPKPADVDWSGFPEGVH